MRLVALRAKKLRYAVELTAAGELREENGVVLETPAEWSPEHLLLAALVRCTLKSFRYHASRSGVDVRSTSGSARALVTRRKGDGRYAVVEAEVDLAVAFEPEAEGAALSDLLEFAERDCFIGSSLTVEPLYRWTVNGRRIGW
jgi:organic hydroperoxide reductase OsmC/OhrA